MLPPLQQALDAFTHRHLRSDVARQRDELRRLCRLHASGFYLYELQTLSQLLAAADEQCVTDSGVADALSKLLQISSIPWRRQATPDTATHAANRVAMLDSLGILACCRADGVHEAATEALFALLEPPKEGPRSEEGQQREAESRSVVAALESSALAVAVLSHVKTLSQEDARSYARLVRCLSLLQRLCRASFTLCQKLIDAGAVRQILQRVSTMKDGGGPLPSARGAQQARPNTAPSRRPQDTRQSLDTTRLADTAQDVDSSDAEDDARSPPSCPKERVGSAGSTRSAPTIGSRVVSAKPRAAAAARPQMSSSATEPTGLTGPASQRALENSAFAPLPTRLVVLLQE